MVDRIAMKNVFRVSNFFQRLYYAFFDPLIPWRLNYIIINYFQSIKK